MVNLMDKNKKINNMLCLVFILSVFITLKNAEAVSELPTIEEIENIRQDIKERDKVIFFGEITSDAILLIEAGMGLMKAKELETTYKESLIKQKQQEAKKYQLVLKKKNNYKKLV